MGYAFIFGLVAAGLRIVASLSGGVDPTTAVKNRWRILEHNRENPLMRTGQLLTCLAVEHELGNREALKIIRLALNALGTLYKFSGNDFDGYIVRWDAVTSDNWVTRDQNGQPTPQFCRDFLIDPQGRYLYCLPFSDPRYVPRLVDENKQSKYVELYRHSEPCQDELVGLLMGYQMVYRLLSEPDIKDEVKCQANNLGKYLASYGYYWFALSAASRPAVRLVPYRPWNILSAMFFIHHR